MSQFDAREDVGGVSWLPTIITADSLHAGARAGALGHRCDALRHSTLAVNTATVHPGVVIKRLDCRLLSRAAPSSREPLSTASERSSISCDDHGSSSSGGSSDTPEAADHANRGAQQGSRHATFAAANGRLQQQATTQQSQPQQHRPAAPAPGAIQPTSNSQPPAAPRPPLRSSSSQRPRMEVDCLAPSAYHLKRRMLAQARRRLHATAPERLVGLHMPLHSRSIDSCFKPAMAGRLRGAATPSPAAAGGAGPAKGGAAAASPARRGPYNTRRRSKPAPKAAVRAAAGGPRPARRDTALLAAAAAAGQGPTAREVCHGALYLGATPPCAPAAATGTADAGGAGQLYADFLDPPLPLHGTVITAASLVSPPCPSVSPWGMGSAAAYDVCQPMELLGSGGACIGWPGPHGLPLSEGAVMLGGYGEVQGAWGPTGVHPLQYQDHQQQAGALLQLLPAGGAAAAGAEMLTGWSPPAAAACGAAGTSAQEMEDSLALGLPSLQALAALEALPEGPLERLSSDLSCSSMYWPEQDVAPVPNMQVPSLSPPPPPSAAAVDPYAAAVAVVGACPTGELAVRHGLQLAHDGSSPIVDVRDLLEGVWGDDADGLDAVLEQLMEEELPGRADPMWPEGWEELLQL